MTWFGKLAILVHSALSQQRDSHRLASKRGREAALLLTKSSLLQH